MTQSVTATRPTTSQDEELRSCLDEIIGQVLRFEAADDDARLEVSQRIEDQIERLLKALERRTRASGTVRVDADRGRTTLLSARRILVVDDDARMCDLFRRALPAGVELLYARDGAEAVELARRANAAIVAWRADGFAGPEILVDLKIRHPQLPVLVTASAEDAAYESVATLLGADRFAERPSTSLEALAVVDESPETPQRSR
jgi:CheY-like chemotaxis protein